MVKPMTSPLFKKDRPMRPLLSGLFALALGLGCASGPTAMPLQPAGCDDIMVDTAGGTLNGLPPTASQAEVMAQFPCMTGDTVDGAEFNCGGGVFYLNHDFYGYTGRDYWEVRSRFKGRTDVPVLGESRASLEKTFGKPARVQEHRSDTYLFFAKPWGTLVVKLGSEGTATKLSMFANKSHPKVELCL